VTGEGAIWLPDLGRAIIYRIAPESSRDVKEIPVDGLGSAGIQARSWDQLAAGEGSVWVIIGNNELRRYSAGDAAHRVRGVDQARVAQSVVRTEVDRRVPALL
jgi:hypothetical protein